MKRWEVPRHLYDDGRVGYLKWRKDLAKMHADIVESVLREEGFVEEVIQETRRINLKEGIKHNSDVQAMEDALCLSFLEHEYEPFAGHHEDDKVVDIVKKTWRKMSPEAHDLALQLPFTGRPLELIKKALSEAPLK